MSRNNRDGVRSPRPPGWMMAWSRVDCETVKLSTSLVRSAVYVADSPRRSETARTPSSSSAASTKLTRALSLFTRFELNTASACVNHCLGECLQNPGRRTCAMAAASFVAGLSSGVVVGRALPSTFYRLVAWRWKGPWVNGCNRMKRKRVLSTCSRSRRVPLNGWFRMAEVDKRKHEVTNVAIRLFLQPILPT